MHLSAEDARILGAAMEKANPSRVLLQAPEGMKTSVQDIAGKIRSLGPECIIWADPCFGACDIPGHHAKALGCDLIVHIGHAPFRAYSDRQVASLQVSKTPIGFVPWRCREAPQYLLRKARLSLSGRALVKSKIPVLFLENRMDTDFTPIIKAGISGLPHKKIGLLASIQHIGEIQNVAHILEKEGKAVFLGKSPRLKYAGQVLGCDAGAALAVEDDVDCFLLLSGGKFHAFGVLKKVQKPVFLANVDTGKIENLLEEKKLMEKKRILKIAKLKDAKNVGILVSTKSGQLFRNFEHLRKKLEAQGKNVWIIAMDYISPEKILGMKLDALINTACPRLEDDLVFPMVVIDKSQI